MIFYQDLVYLPFNKHKEQSKEILEKSLSSNLLTKDKKVYLENSAKLIEKWCYAYKKYSRNLGIYETNRVENVNRYLKQMLKNSSISIPELIIRFFQFDSYFNKIDKTFHDETNKFNEIKEKIEEIPIIKLFQINIVILQKSNLLTITGKLNFLIAAKVQKSLKYLK